MTLYLVLLANDANRVAFFMSSLAVCPTLSVKARIPLPDTLPDAVGVVVNTKESRKSIDDDSIEGNAIEDNVELEAPRKFPNFPRFESAFHNLKVL